MSLDTLNDDAIGFLEVDVAELRRKLPGFIQREVQSLVRDRQFVVAWPDWVREAANRAMNTEGLLPPFAVKQVEDAMRVADRIERKMLRDIEQGEFLAGRR